MHSQKDKRKYRYATLAVAFTVAAGPAFAQTPAKAAADAEDELIVLTPFEVSAEKEAGYTAATTLAGNRLNSDLRDLGSSVSVVTSQFLRDVGATDNRTLLQYTTNTEVGSTYGNFAGLGDGPSLTEGQSLKSPNTSTRVRGLAAADNTRDLFMTDIPWEGYNVDRVDLQRGPNSILFGQGSPAGIINTGTKQASFRDSNEVSIRYGSYDTKRATLDINKVLLKDELAIRIDALYKDEGFKQEPAFSRDERVYGAVRYEPKWLKKGDARTVLKANYEAGKINSNNPRSLPPIDRISPWFGIDPLNPEKGVQNTYKGDYVFQDGKWVSTRTYQAVNKGTYSPFQIVDNNTSRPGNGVTVRNNAFPGGGPNDYYQPWIFQSYGDLYGGPLAMFNANGTDASSIPGTMVFFEPYDPHFMKGGLKSDGTVDGEIRGIPWTRPGSIASYSRFAKNARLPLGDLGVYKDISLTDPSIYDFYNKLIDGDNKKEWQRFEAYNLSVAQTFFNDQLGFEAVLDKQSYRDGQLSILTGDRVSLNIDVNSIYSDGTVTGTGTWPNNVPYADGTTNKNVGRAYVSDSGKYGNNSLRSDRESQRFTAFMNHDFTHDFSDNWVTKLIGKHTLTGLFSRDELEQDFRQWQRYSSGSDYYNFLRRNNEKLLWNNDYLNPNTIIYLGDSLSGRNSPAGANLPNASTASVITSGPVWIFDGTWNKPTDPSAPGYVNPSDPWTWALYPEKFPNGTVPADLTLRQADNPSNYVGWRKQNMTVIDSEAAEGNRDLNATSGRLTRSEVSSKAAVWQGHFWQNAIVGTWGVRQDTAKSYEYSATYNSSSPAADPTGRINFDQNQYKIGVAPSNRIDVTSHSWMVVAHLNDFPGLDKLTERLPVNVSLFYNKSTNFQPASARVDLYGEPLGAPSGKTVDKGFLIETKDGKYSVRLSKYETSVKNASSAALNDAAAIGRLQSWAANWANNFEFNWTGNTIATAVANPVATNNQYNYEPDTTKGETWETAAIREKAAVDAWRVWQKSVDPRFYNAWKINLNDYTRAVDATQPNGFAVTEDSLSEGYEVEFSAMPVKNWRVAINGSKTEATRYNIGGKNLLDFVAAYEKALKTTAAGDLRIWWGTPANDTTLQQWSTGIGSDIKQKTLLNGTAVPELREWRYNAITNYDFDHGVLKDFNVGGGVRYESGNILGYMPVVDPKDPSSVTWDFSKPYKADDIINYDLWVGYRRKVWRNVEWNIQLNVRNVGVGDELIPVTVNPRVLDDGTMGFGPGTYRIRPPMTWEVTNTFRF